MVEGVQGRYELSASRQPLNRRTEITKCESKKDNKQENMKINEGSLEEKDVPVNEREAEEL